MSWVDRLDLFEITDCDLRELRIPDARHLMHITWGADAIPLEVTICGFKLAEYSSVIRGLLCLD